MRLAIAFVGLFSVSTSAQQAAGNDEDLAKQLANPIASLVSVGTDVNQMFLQPFASYQATRTITLTLQSEMTANWNADEDDST